jgi:H+/Cl- antiporter ClcA
MPFTEHPRRILAELTETALRCLLTLPVAAAAGSASALFLWTLERVTHARFDHAWLLWTLPALGILSVALYRLCDRSGRGNNLILDEIHAPGGGVPLRLAPLVLVSTLLTHLGGGSAGREGTAVQMGGGLAGGWARALRLNPVRTRIILMAGIAAGFGSVFGTPLAGAVFAVEVLVAGSISYGAILPCLVAAYAGDFIARAWGVEHARLPVSVPGALVDTASGPFVALFAKSLLAGAAFGLCAAFFSRLLHKSGALQKKLIPNDYVRVVVGGFVVILLALALGTHAYLGIGVYPVPGEPGAATITAAFAVGGVGAFAWFWKSIFTGITLGAGFKGGEVTPLFFIGACLGNALAGPLGMPVDLAAALGFVAVFAGAANTPLAGTLLGIELFGAEFAPFFAAACFVAYKLSGPGGIYTAQRTTSEK